MPTYSTTVGSSSDDIVLDLQVRVEDRCVELGLAVEAVADALPIGGWLGHCRGSGVHTHITYTIGRCTGVWRAVHVWKLARAEGATWEELVKAL